MTASHPLNLPQMRFSFSLRIFYFLLIAFVGLMLALVAMTLIMGGMNSTVHLRIATVAQDMLLFIVPAIATSVLVSYDGGRMLCVDRIPVPPVLLMGLVVYVCGIPAMNALVAWNESLTLPASLAPLEEAMRQSEDAAKEAVEILFGGTSWGDLIVCLLIVGVLAGVSEELFFRGAMQRLLSSGRMGPHAAIWVTAIVFSVFHMQFYGFFPRVILGAFFGYLLYWSGSVWLPVMLHVLNNSLVVWTTWYSRRQPGTDIVDIDKIGADSTVMIVVSAVLVTGALVLLKDITKKQNCVTR